MGRVESFGRRRYLGPAVLLRLHFRLHALWLLFNVNDDWVLWCFSAVILSTCCKACEQRRSEEKSKGVFSTPPPTDSHDMRDDGQQGQFVPPELDLRSLRQAPWRQHALCALRGVRLRFLSILLHCSHLISQKRD